MTPIRGRWSFSLRALFAGKTALAIVCAYLVHEWRWVQRRAEYWPRFNDSSLREIVPLPLNGRRNGIPWIRRLLGDTDCGTLLYNPKEDVDGKQLREVRELFPEADIWGWPTDGRLGPPLPEGIRPWPDDVGFMI